MEGLGGSTDIKDIRYIKDMKERYNRYKITDIKDMKDTKDITDMKDIAGAWGIWRRLLPGAADFLFDGLPKPPERLRETPEAPGLSIN